MSIKSAVFPAGDLINLGPCPPFDESLTMLLGAAHRAQSEGDLDTLRSIRSGLAQVDREVERLVVQSPGVN